MHICFITSEFPKEGFPHGGAGTFVATISKYLVKKGFKISVVGINYCSEYEVEEHTGITIYRIKPKYVSGLTWFLNSQSISNKIKQIHKKDEINIIESAELGLAFLPKLKGIKYIIRLHGGHHFFAEAEKREINWWSGLQEKLSFRKADAFVAVSEYVKNHTQKYLSYNNKPIQTINYPVSFEKFIPLENVKIVSNSIVFAGTLCEKKGIRQLIEAVPLVEVKFPNVHLNVYGRDSNNSTYLKFLKSNFSDHTLQKVTFHGAISHDKLAKVYQQAEVCVFPSHMETQGLVVPEAMAMEKPVIFSNLGPGPETIIPYKTGLLCNPHEPEDIADKILWVFENKDYAIDMGLKAREAALKKFDPDEKIIENINFYISVLTNK